MLPSGPAIPECGTGYPGGPCDQTMGIMSIAPVDMMNSNKGFIPRYQNLIRSRVQSPGY